MKRNMTVTDKDSATSNKEHGNAAKPLSLHPLKFEDAVAALLKVKPEPKPEK
jgi:hypothetical protein